MPNAWIMHIKKWSAANNIPYSCAVSNPDCRSSYKNPPQQDEVKVVRTFKKKKKM